MVKLFLSVMILLVHILYWPLGMNRHMVIFSGFHWDLYSSQFSFALACISLSSKLSVSKLMLAVYRYYTYVHFSRGFCEGVEYVANIDYNGLWQKFDNEMNRLDQMEDAERGRAIDANVNQILAAVRNRN